VRATLTKEQRAAKKEEKRIDNEINRLYSQHGQNVQINILDIPKVFKAGHAAVVAGQSLEQSVLDSIAKYRQN
jgi:ribosomal protein L18E